MSLEIALEVTEIVETMPAERMDEYFQSPLLNIQGYANVLKEADNTEESVQYLGIIESETKRLSALTKQLLLLSSLDQKNLPIKKQTFSLDQQLNELLFAKRWKLDDQ